jgi:hypothetical protein
MCTSGQRLAECKAPATVRLVCSGWKCRHDALVMWLLLGQDATDEGRGGPCWCGAEVARWTSTATTPLLLPLPLLQLLLLESVDGRGVARSVSSLTALTAPRPPTASA